MAAHIYVWDAHFVGVGAVANFFIISGYVMAGIMRANYSHLGKPTLFFYLDRALRIFPQYLFYLLATQACLLCFDFRFMDWFYTGTPSSFLFLMNALIVPMNYFEFFPVIVLFFAASGLVIGVGRAILLALSLSAAKCMVGSGDGRRKCVGLCLSCAWENPYVAVGLSSATWHIVFIYDGEIFKRIQSV